MDEQDIKHILCYGDSNTYGYDALLDRRFPREQRWPGVLRTALGAAYEIIEEGLGSRTTIYDDPMFPYRNGKDYLLPCMESHMPLDLVIILLGTNDLKRHFELSPQEVAYGADVLVAEVQQSTYGRANQAPQVLLLAPPIIGPLSNFRELYAGAEEKSRVLGGVFEQVAQHRQCGFLDTACIIKSCEADGLHFEVEEHAKLGKAVARQVLQMLEGQEVASLSL